MATNESLSQSGLAVVKSCSTILGKAHTPLKLKDKLRQTCELVNRLLEIVLLIATPDLITYPLRSSSPLSTILASNIPPRSSAPCPLFHSLPFVNFKQCDRLILDQHQKDIVLRPRTHPFTLPTLHCRRALPALRKSCFRLLESLRDVDTPPHRIHPECWLQCSQVCETR